MKNRNLPSTMTSITTTAVIIALIQSTVSGFSLCSTKANRHSFSSTANTRVAFSNTRVYAPHHRTANSHFYNRNNKNTFLASSTLDDHLDNRAVLEDVDGIGQLTINTPETSSVPTAMPASTGIEIDTLVANAESTATATTTVVPEAQEILNEILLNEPLTSTEQDSINTNSIVDESSSTLLDPSAVVELVLGSALADAPDSGTTSPLEVVLPSIDPTAEAPVLLPSTSTEIEEHEKEEVIEAPSLQKIIKFAIPAIGVWLCSPLLSLIDTSSVGLLSGTAQQAALNPAVAVTDYGALLVAFMYTATTNLVASAQSSDAGTGDAKPKTAKTLVNALQLSVYVGAILGSTLITFARPLLKSMIGNDAIDPEVFGAAMRYVRIRALGMPAAVVIGSAQSACLGMQDIRTPLYVLAAAASVNFLGDMIFVPCSHAWLGGAAGAAWATVFSQYAALGMFIKWLTMKRKDVNKNDNQDSDTAKKVNLTDAILELTGKSDEGKSRRRKLRQALKNFRATNSAEDTPLTPTAASVTSDTAPATTKNRKEEKPFSARGFLANRFSFPQLVKFPPKEDAKIFWPYFIPVTTTAVGRVSSYVAMSHVVSSSLGTLSMAANQIVVSLFYCLTPIADSVNLTAQSFLPSLYEKKSSLAKSAALKKTKNNFLKVGVLFGGVMAALSSSIFVLGKYFTTDPLVIGQVHSIVPLLASTFALHGLICSSEGLLLGQKDLGFLGKAYASFFFAVPYFMLRVKSAALAGVEGIGLKSVWSVFLAYQVARLSMWIARLEILQFQNHSEAQAVATERSSGTIVP